MRRRRAVAGLLAGAVATLTMLLAPMAWADDPGFGLADAVAPVTERPTGSGADPVALAHTGLNLAIPTVAGLAVLLIGTTLVVWAVLRGSRSRGSRP